MTLFDKPDTFIELFNRLQTVCRRLRDEFPELDSNADLSGADAVDRITEIRAEAIAVLDQLNSIEEQRDATTCQ